MSKFNKETLKASYYLEGCYMDFSVKETLIFLNQGRLSMEVIDKLTDEIENNDEMNFKLQYEQTVGRNNG